MNHQQLLRRIVRVILVSSFLVGCGTPAATPTFVPATPPPTSTSTRVPPTPTPVGCSGTPNIASFAVSDSTISPGQSTTLRWGAVTNAESAEIDQGIGGVATPGSANVMPNKTTTYRLTARCGGNVATAQLTVNVISMLPVATQPAVTTAPSKPKLSTSALTLADINLVLPGAYLPPDELDPPDFYSLEDYGQRFIGVGVPTALVVLYRYKDSTESSRYVRVMRDDSKKDTVNEVQLPSNMFSEQAWMYVNMTKGMTVLCFSQGEVMVLVAVSLPSNASLPSDKKAEAGIALAFALGTLQQVRLQVDGYK